MEIRIDGRGKVGAEEIRKYCARTVAAVDECLRTVQGLGECGDTQAVVERLIKLLADANDTAAHGERFAVALEKKENIASMYQNIEL